MLLAEMDLFLWRLRMNRARAWSVGVAWRAAQTVLCGPGMSQWGTDCGKLGRDRKAGLADGMTLKSGQKMNHCLTDQVQAGGGPPLPVPGGRWRGRPTAASPACHAGPDRSLGWPSSEPPPVPGTVPWGESRRAQSRPTQTGVFTSPLNFNCHLTWCGNR